MSPDLLSVLGSLAFNQASLYSLHKAACEIKTYRRMDTCGRFPVVGGARVLSTRGFGTALAGVYRCRHYQVCPRCHAVWVRQCRAKLRRIVETWPDGIAQATFTLPHRKGESLSNIIKRLKAVRASFLRLSAVKRLESVTFIEVKITSTGWHPHLHCILLSHSKFTSLETSAIESAWEDAARKNGIKSGKNAARVCGISEDDVTRVADYCIKEVFEGSPFDLVKIVHLFPSSPIALEAMSVWRSYIRAIEEIEGMRFVSACGKHVKTIWSAQSHIKQTRERAFARASLLHEDWAELTAGEDGGFNPYLKSLLPKSNLSTEKLARLAELERQVEEVHVLISEKGYDDHHWHEYQDVIEGILIVQEEILRQPEVNPATLATITPLGLKCLTSDDKSLLCKARSLRDVRLVLEQAVARVPSPLDSVCYYTIRYGADEIDTMYFEPRPLEEMSQKPNVPIRA